MLRYSLLLCILWSLSFCFFLYIFCYSVLCFASLCFACYFASSDCISAPRDVLTRSCYTLSQSASLFLRDVLCRTGRHQRVYNLRMTCFASRWCGLRHRGRTAWLALLARLVPFGIHAVRHATSRPDRSNDLAGLQSVWHATSLPHRSANVAAPLTLSSCVLVVWLAPSRPRRLAGFARSSDVVWDSCCAACDIAAEPLN